MKPSCLINSAHCPDASPTRLSSPGLVCFLGFGRLAGEPGVTQIGVSPGKLADGKRKAGLWGMPLACAAGSIVRGFGWAWDAVKGRPFTPRTWTCPWGTWPACGSPLGAWLAAGFVRDDCGGANDADIYSPRHLSRFGNGVERRAFPQGLKTVDFIDVVRHG